MRENADRRRDTRRSIPLSIDERTERIAILSAGLQQANNVIHGRISALASGQTGRDLEDTTAKNKNQGGALENN